MANQKPLILKDGKVSEMKSGQDTIDPIYLTASDYHSGYNNIATSQVVIVNEYKQMINFIGLTLDGTLTLDGDLWLA